MEKVYNKKIPNVGIEYNEIKDLGKGNFGVVSEIEINRSSLGKYEKNFPKNISRFALKIGNFSDGANIFSFKSEEFIIKEITENFNKCDSDLLCYYFIYFDIKDKKVYFISELMNGDLNLLISIWKKDKLEKDAFVKQLNTLYINIYIAIQKLHEKKIIHRDIKPENIFWKEGSFFPFKLADFGLSCTLIVDSRFFCGNSYTGSIIYQDPVSRLAFLNGKKITNFESDFYSFGFTLFLIWRNFFNFKTNEFQEIMNNVKENEEQSMREFYENLSKLVEKGIEEMQKTKELTAIVYFIKVYVIKRYELIKDPKFIEIILNQANEIKIKK